MEVSPPKCAQAFLLFLFLWRKGLLIRSPCARRCGHRLAAFRLRGGEDVVAARAGECQGGDVLGASGREIGVRGLWYGCGTAFQYWVRGCVESEIVMVVGRTMW